MEKALRRHHYRRIKAKQLRLAYVGTESGTKRHIGISLHTPCICSCYMCGNPRRLGSVTLAELKSNLSYDEWLNGE